MKKLLSIALTFCMIFTLVPTMAFAADDSLDPIITVPDDDAYIYDVFVGTDNNFPYDVSELADAVKDKLIGFGVLPNKVRVSTAVNTIDTTDLTGWYVYDHYDTEHYANQDAWEAVYGPSSIMRPYQGITDFGSAKTIEDLAVQFGSNLEKWGTVYRLNHHIHSYILNNKPAMLFTGYISPAYTDFLYYPANSTGEQKVTFTVDSNYANAHSMHGAGFLINTGIDPETGFISGYVLYYQFEYDSSPAKLTNIGLYKIKDKITAAEFSDKNVEADSKYNQITKYCDQIGNVEAAITDPENPNCNWFSVMDIKLTINPTSVVVEQRDHGNGPYNVKYEWTSLTDTNYHGFGPIVRYERYGHYCSRNSMFVFSDLNMSFKSAAGVATPSNFITLADAKYQDNSLNKSYVNLLSGAYNDPAKTSDLMAVKVLSDSGISLITNYKDPACNYPSEYLGSNAVDLNIIDDENYFGNGAPTVPDKKVATAKEDLTGEQAEDYLTVDELATNIAAAVYNRSFMTESGRDLDADALSDSQDGVAALVLRPEPVDGNKKEIQLIRSGFIGEEGIKVYLDTLGSIGPVGAKLDFTIKKPTGGAVPLTPSSDENGDYFTVTNNLSTWPAGIYTVTAKYPVDLEANPNAESIAASKSFEMAYGVNYIVDKNNTAPTPQTKILNEPITIADGNPLVAPEGCSFAYWMDESDNKYLSNSTCDTNDNLELTAKWKLDSIITEFTHNNENAQENPNTVTVKWHDLPDTTSYMLSFYKNEAFGVSLGNVSDNASDIFTTENGIVTYEGSLARPEDAESLIAVVTPTFKTAISDLDIPYDVSTISTTVPGGDGLGNTVYSQGWVDAVFGKSGADRNGLWIKETNTIKLLADIIVREPITFPKDVTLDLNGNSIYGKADNHSGKGVKAIILPEEVTLTLQDNSQDHTGAISGGMGSSTAGYALGKEAGAANLGSITLDGTMNLLQIGDIEGKKFTNITILDGIYDYSSMSINAAKDITINGGTITVAAIEAGANININAGNIYSKMGIVALDDLNISNATVSTDGVLGTVDGDIILNGTKIVTPQGGSIGTLVEYDEGNYNNVILASDGAIAEGVLIEMSKRSSGSAPSAVTVPVSSDAGNADVSAVVSGDQANVTITDKQLDEVISSTDKTGIVSVDLTGLSDKVNTAQIPAEVISSTVDSDTANGLTVKLPSGVITLDETALEAVDRDKDIVVSVEEIKLSALSKEQNETLGDKADKAVVVEVKVLIDGVEVSNFNGGKITVSFPYTLPAGIDPSLLTIWYIADDGTIEKVGGSYNPTTKLFTFTTTHLSYYVLVYDETAEVIDVTKKFVDVKATDYYADAVAWAVQNGVTEGIDDTHFEPSWSCTRAQMVTFLWRANGCPEPKNTTCAFTDISDKEYYYKAVLWAAENKYTEGTSETTFSPNVTVTRGQAVTFLWRINGKNVQDLSNPFTDVLNEQYYHDAVAWAFKNGITEGTSDTTFGPEEDCTRAQIVTFLYRYFTK